MSAPFAKSDSTMLSASLDRKEFRQANAAARTAGSEIARNFAKASRRQRLQLANTFKHQLLPPRKGGRRSTETITAAPPRSINYYMVKVIKPWGTLSNLYECRRMILR
jgi:hypothetical protein